MLNGPRVYVGENIIIEESTEACWTAHIVLGEWRGPCDVEIQSAIVVTETL